MTWITITLNHEQLLMANTVAKALKPNADSESKVSSACCSNGSLQWLLLDISIAALWGGHSGLLSSNRHIEDPELWNDRRAREAWRWNAIRYSKSTSHLLY